MLLVVFVCLSAFRLCLCGRTDAVQKREAIDTGRETAGLWDPFLLCRPGVPIFLLLPLVLPVSFPRVSLFLPLSNSSKPFNDLHKFEAAVTWSFFRSLSEWFSAGSQIVCVSTRSY